MTPREASYFLYNFPGLSEAAAEKRADILEQGRQGAFAGGFRGGGTPDPTAYRAILLADGSELERILSQVGQWINFEMPPKDRPLLLAAWRLGRFGWHWVAKDLKVEVWQCRFQWDKLTAGLAAYLNQSAGTAPAHPGAASAASRMNP